MVKKTTSFRLEPRVLKKLKFMSLEREMPIGDILEALVSFAEVEQKKYINDDLFKKRFKELLEMSFQNAGQQQRKNVPGKEKTAEIDAAKKENGQ